MKLLKLKISNCTRCCFYEGYSFGLGEDCCYHPEVIIGVTPKIIESLPDVSFLERPIPNWCPLEDINE